jgi:hypothetical protein
MPLSRRCERIDPVIRDARCGRIPAVSDGQVSPAASAAKAGVHRKKATSSGDVRPPEFWVFPVADVQAAQDPNESWGKVYLRRFDHPDRYRDAWDLILEHLDTDPASDS